MTRKSIPPSINETAFDCPHCGAFTTQSWFHVKAEGIDKERRTPLLLEKEWKKQLDLLEDIPSAQKEWIGKRWEKLSSGLVFLERNASGAYIYCNVENLFLSQCYNCDKVAVWVHDRLLFPLERHGVPPNTDLPEDVLHDYEEARAILDLSPRGAAALLRLCVQKLCHFLGEKGKNIDEDIARLVRKGLDPLVQQSLDAVHPGVMDLSDDRDTAASLFGLVNAIADQMITHPNTVKALYEKLPESRRAAIAARNAKASRQLD